TTPTTVAPAAIPTAAHPTGVAPITAVAAVVRTVAVPIVDPTPIPVATTLCVIASPHVLSFSAISAYIPSPKPNPINPLPIAFPAVRTELSALKKGLATRSDFELTMLKELGP